jgi:hypothetical protein
MDESKSGDHAFSQATRIEYWRRSSSVDDEQRLSLGDELVRNCAEPLHTFCCRVQHMFCKLRLTFTCLPLLGQARAAKKTSEKQRKKSSKIVTDCFYADCLSLRSLPVSAFLQDAPGTWVLPITSINESRLLKEMGLPDSERFLIEGLQLSASVAPSDAGFTAEQRSNRAIVRMAADPPQSVGVLQRLTAKALLRPFPNGMRFSGKNMSPLPGCACARVWIRAQMLVFFSGRCSRAPELRDCCSAAGSWARRQSR